MYRSLGFVLDPSKYVVRKVTYHIARACISDIRVAFGNRQPTQGFAWKMPFDIDDIGSCFHGGESMTLQRDPQHIRADVLDAWYPPSPTVMAAITKDLAGQMHTTPPTGSPDLVQAIATARGVHPNHIIIGAGSSDLIYRCFLKWLSPESRVLLLDPTYGEYAHILDMIKCHVTKFALNDTYDIDLQALRAASVGCDLVVLVNPNSPTGRWADLMAVLPHIACTVWVDETYIEFAGDVSVETYAASSMNVIVCKSMSKVYALSGIRVAYACGSPIHFAAIKVRTPPWNVSRLAQSAGIAALSNESMAYYSARIKETHQFTKKMMHDLEWLGMVCIPGCANFVMARLPRDVCADTFVHACTLRNVYIRTVHDNYIRVAIKDPVSNARMIYIFQEVLDKLR
jgi:histidinol-phosphate/aromatic aminotransferase/cobyric acid decarboxylase-like protein